MKTITKISNDEISVIETKTESTNYTHDDLIRRRDFILGNKVSLDMELAEVEDLLTKLK